MRIRKLEHQFTQSIPRELEPGVLYVSMEYATAAHSCCCGCGEQVVTPFSPTDWKLLYDGESVSLTPSIGNWNSACRSHYFIRHGCVIEAEAWSQARIESEYRRDKAAKAHFYRDKASIDCSQNTQSHDQTTTISDVAHREQHSEGFWSSIKTWLFGGSSRQ